MPYRLAADLVVLVHLGFILFVVFGSLLAFRIRWMPWVHVPVVVWGVAIEWAGWICPLTPLENSLRAAAGDATYAGDFVDRYLIPVIYPAHLTRTVQVALGTLVLVVNLAAYGTLTFRMQHGARKVTNGIERE